MNQNLNGYRKKVWSLLVLAVFGFSIFSPSAEARLIFTTEDDGVESDVYTLDVDGTVNLTDNTDLSLNFGANLGASITYNDSTGQFTVNKDLNLGGNFLEDVRVENLAADPVACTAPIEGRIYYNTTDDEIKYCDGSAWQGFSDGSLSDSLADGNLFVGNAGGTATGVALSGDATIDNTGALSLAADSVDSAEIATGAVGTDEIADGTVGADDLGTDSVGSDEISTGAVGTDEIADGTVGSDDLGTDSVDSDEIAADAVGDSEIDYSAVTLADFTNDLALTSAQIFVGNGSGVAAGVAASGDVTLDNAGAFTIADNSVDGTDIALGGDTAGDTMYYDGTDWVRLAIGTAGQTLEVNGGATAPVWVNNTALDDSLADGNLFVGNAGGTATGVALSGDATIDNTGALSLAADSVDSAEIATGAVGTDEIADGTVGADDLGTDSVGSDEISTGAVGTDEIADGTVGSDDLGTDSVDSDEIAADAVGDSEIDYSAVTLADFTNDLALTSAQIFVGNGSGVAAGVAASGDVTLDNAGAFTIADNSVDGTDIALGGDTAGDTMYYDGTDWVRLAIGTAGQVLTTNGGATAPAWDDVATTIEDLTDTNITAAADGNVLVYDATAGEWINQAISGDATVDEAGALSLAADSVDSAEIATDAVGDDEIDYAAVTLADFTNDLALGSANLFVGNGSGVATGVALSGDATIDNAGALSLATDSVDSDEIATGAVGTDEIADGTITQADIAAEDVTVSMPPEFPNFTITADGSNNRGTLESDYDGTNNRNYYQWTTRRGAMQDYDLVVQWPIPEDFADWQAAPLSFDYRTNTGTDTDNQIDVTSILDTGGTSLAITGDTADLASATWAAADVAGFGAGTFTAGEFITITFKLQSTNGGDFAQLGALQFNYTAK